MLWIWMVCLHSQLLWHLLAWLLLLQLRHLRNSQSLFVFATAACRCNPPPLFALCVCKCCSKVHAPCATAAVCLCGCALCPYCIYKFICMCLLRSAPFGLPAVWPTLLHLNWKFSGVLNFQFAIIWPGNQCLLCRCAVVDFF